MMRNSLPQACALTKGIMVSLLCLSVLFRDAGSRLRLSRSHAVRLVDASARLASGTQNGQLRQPLRMRSNGGGHRVTGNGNDVRRMFSRRSQRGLKAIVVSFIDRLAQRNSCVLERPNMVRVVHQNRSPLRESKQLPGER